MGSIYAGLLADAGNDVWAIDTWAEHVEAILAKGLRVEGASGDRVVRLTATKYAREAGAVDLVVIATKAMDVKAAALAARDVLGDETVVLTIQNGLGSADLVAGVVGADRVIVGVVGGFGASIVAPGHVYHHGWELLRLGELGRPPTFRLKRIADVWTRAGFRVGLYDDIDQLIWEKLICNVCYSPTCALLECRIGDVINDTHAWLVASRCAEEAFTVAQAGGIGLEFDDPVAYVREFGMQIPAARPSMLLDLLARRPCEIDFINGAIVDTAARLGFEAPRNEAVTALVKAKESLLLGQ
jgi:2-dehydropantoate 2-reductase